MQADRRARLGEVTPVRRRCSLFLLRILEGLHKRRNIPVKVLSSLDKGNVPTVLIIDALRGRDMPSDMVCVDRQHMAVVVSLYDQGGKGDRRDQGPVIHLALEHDLA